MIDYIVEQEAIYVTNAIGHAQKLLQKGCRVFLLGGELKRSDRGNRRRTGDRQPEKI